MAKLVINPGTVGAREFELKPGSNYVGRGFANDLTLEDASVSTSHCQISVNGTSVILKDLGSTNGTFINDARVTEAALRPGQSLRLGALEMIFENNAPQTAATLDPVNIAEPLPPIGSAEILDSTTLAPARVRVSAPISIQTEILKSPPGLELPPPPVAKPPPVPVVPAIPQSPPPAPEMFELPDGKSNCKSHKKNPAQWYCPKCRAPFCSLCVSARRAGDHTGHFCQKCGTECVPVKVKYTATREKGPVIYSDVMVLMRSVGFGLGAAILSGVLWAGLAKVMGLTFLMMPPFVCWGTGGICGYAVKVASQDRPGIIFSLIACGFCVLGVLFGFVGVALVGGRVIIGVYTLLGFLFGFFTAWKISGGDF